MRAETCLVTGGLGFIGSALSKHLLALGSRVVIVDDLSAYTNRESPLDPFGADVILGDVRDASFMQGLLRAERPDVIFHLAARHFIPDCDRDPGGCVSINAAGSVVVLEASTRAESPPVCVFASSAAVYAPAETAHRESDKLGPIDIYGLSKLWGEQATELYFERRGLRASVARLFNVYGPGETNPHLIPALIGQALVDKVVRVGALATKRDYVHVDDVVRALVLMAKVADEDRLTFINIGSGSAVSGDAVVQCIASALGHDVTIAVDPSRLRNVDRPVLLSDSARAADLLGWRPSVSFDTGIRELVIGSLAAGKLV